MIVHHQFIRQTPNLSTRYIRDSERVISKNWRDLLPRFGEIPRYPRGVKTRVAISAPKTKIIHQRVAIITRLCEAFVRRSVRERNARAYKRSLKQSSHVLRAALSLSLSLYFSLPLSLFLPRRGRFLKAHSLMSRRAGIVLPLRRGAEFFPLLPSLYFLLSSSFLFFFFFLFIFNLACPRTYMDFSGHCYGHTT